MSPISFKNLKFQDRKIVHYSLFLCMLLLQSIAVLTWYNETVNEQKITKAFADVGAANKVNQYTGNINTALVASQLYFNHYMDFKDQASLDGYLKAVQHTSVLLDSLNLIPQNTIEFKKLLANKNQVATTIVSLKTAIDSVLNRQLYPKTIDVAAPFQFRNFNSKKILDSIKTKTYIKVDSISRKGLLSRLLAAFTGRIEIQKEQLNTIITMKYKDKITTGTLEEQMNQLILTSNQYYGSEFQKLKTAFQRLGQKDSQLVQFNTQLLQLCTASLPEYTAAAHQLKANSQTHLQKQYASNKVIRSYTLVALILLMFLISMLLFGFTRLAFEYEQKLTQAQEKIRDNLNFKNRIIGMISHEIRSPLTILALYSQKISATISDLTLKDTFKSIQFTTNSLLLLSNQILEFSKEEKQPLQLRTKNFLLKTEIHQIIASMNSLVESHGNQIVLHSNLTDEEVCSDVAKIHQLFYNIIGNANKFTENGMLTITLEQENYSDYEVLLKATIQDTGAGIAEADLAHVFEPHYQGTASGTSLVGSVGLGLNLCQEITTLFDGSIAISSRVQEGTTVVFHLILSKV